MERVTTGGCRSFPCGADDSSVVGQSAVLIPVPALLDCTLATLRPSDYEKYPVGPCSVGLVEQKGLVMTFVRIGVVPTWMWVGAVVAALWGCGGPQAVRGDEVAGLDDQAMSTGLDRRDLEKLLRDNLQTLQGSAIVKRWEKENRPAVAVLPLRNETSEHVDSALESLISDIETALVNAGHVRVVTLERGSDLMREVRAQQSDAYNPQQVARWGQMVGAQYLVTGKVFSSDERFEGERRVQYSLFLQVLDVETGDILFQNKTTVTKALVT
jgi:uncharacterized protein (TIGR02722 family)